MMFDTLVCPLSSDQEEEDCKNSFEIFKGSTKSLCEEVLQTKTSLEDYEYEFQSPVCTRDPILTYLQRYYSVSQPGEHLDSSVSEAGDLSWDEGDMPQLCLKVWTFNDFMEQYNNIYTWLNNIQVQYHADKRSQGASPRVEALLRDLERDVERRERFLRECGRMVGSYPELEEEVGWRVEHVMTKWDMLIGLRTKSRNNLADIHDVYSDIELEVRCLRRWLREMEARIDPLQFSRIATWSARDREKKMAEYQVLQTDIESHGRIVKLVLGLCEDLAVEPGQYDVQHAVKVARGLERRWHGIWLRSLEWQCLLEQWLTASPAHNNMLDETDEEPLAKMAKFNTDLDTPYVSPAVTLLRKKKRKRLINVQGHEDRDCWDPEKRIKLKSPRTPRILPESEESEDDCIVVTSMVTSESSDPSTESAPSTSRSERSDSVTLIFRNRSRDGNTERLGNEADLRHNGQVTNMAETSSLDVTGAEWPNENQNNNPIMRTSTPIGDQNHFIQNTVKRKVTVIGNQNSMITSQQDSPDHPAEILREALHMEMFSQDSLDDDDLDGFDEEQVGGCLELLSDQWTPSDNMSHSSEPGSVKENFNATGDLLDMESLHFGEDYRLFINSLSDNSVSNDSRNKSKKFRRKNKRRDLTDTLPYESQSEAEFDDQYLVVSKSQRQIHAVEHRVNDFLSRGFVDTQDLKEYDDILAKCSENVNLLHNFLETIDTTQSFVARKKCRETRLLISRWENLLQKLLENVNNSKVFESLKDESKHLRDIAAGLQDTINSAITDVDLQTQMRKLKAIHDELSSQRAKMDQLIISVHNFLAEVGSSSWVDDRHLALAEGLKDEVVALYSDWDAASRRVRVSLERTEESASKLAEIERELIEFRNSLRSKQLHLAQKSGTKKLRGLKGGGGGSSSHDSGISDASSSLLSDYGLPEALEHLSRLQGMTRSLELTLSPRDPTLVSLTRILTDTSLELDDLQKMYLRQKTPAPVVRKKTARRKMIGREKVRPSAYPVTKSSRLGKFARVTVSLQALLMSLLLLSWMCQPQCCDSISAISFSSPTFKFVNGPPPI